MKVDRTAAVSETYEIPPDTVDEIKRVEAQLLAAGWLPERLWATNHWPHLREPRGLAGELADDCYVIAVRDDHVIIGEGKIVGERETVYVRPRPFFRTDA